MQLPKVNGYIDFDMLADLVATKILVVADTTVNMKTKHGIEKFIKDVLIEVNKHK